MQQIENNWITQQSLANKLNVSVQVVHNWVQRGNIAKKKIAELNITLVDPSTLSVRKYTK